MEDLRHSLHRNHPSATLPKKNSTVNGFATKTAYDDVFGGPPKFSVPSFPSRITDYGEIFGGFYTPKTSSIPFLDFPAADEDDFAVDVRSSNFDYSEVFGGFNGGDFAVSYEELFTEPKSSESASTDDWIPAGADTLQRIPAVVTRDPLEELREDPFACSEKNQFMPNGASDHGTKQFSVSYHKTSHRTREDAINGTTHIAQLHVVPGYTSFVDACSLSEKTESIKTVPQLSNDSSLHVDFNEGTVEGTHSGKTMLQNRSGISIMKTSGNDLKADQKQFNSENSALEDASANGQHQLHYSSDHLTSDGDRSYRDGMFLTVSEINLRTQPSHVPPPARPPPKLVSRQGHSKGMMSANLTAYPDGHFHKPLTTDQAYTFGGAFETYVVEEAVKDISPPFFDVEVDVSSAAAAASAAAMKAMEQAQVRLKSAKESMERKRGNLQNKKLGSTENIKGKEKREGKIVQEAKKFKEGIVAQEAYEIEKSEMKDFNGEEKRKAIREAPVAPDFEKKGRHVKLDKDSLEKKQTKDSRIALDFFKPEESMGEWKAEKQFYELVKNEKFKVAEASGWENNESKLTETPMAYDNKQNDSKATKDALKSDEKEGKLNAFKEANEQEENDKKLKAAREACQRRENEKILREALEALELEENENKLKSAQEALEQEENCKKPKSAQEALERAESEKKVKAAQEALEWEENEKHLKAAEEAREQEEKKKKLKAVQEALVRQENEKKLKAAQEALLRQENEKKLKVAQEALVREENERKQKAAQEALVREENEKKLKAAQEALVRENEKKQKAAQEALMRENEKKQKAAQEALMREENEKKLKATQEALVRQENEKKLKAAQEALVREENEKKQRAAQAALVREENEKKLKAAQEALVRQENEDKLKAALVREEHEKKLKAVQEALENEKKLKAAHEALVREEHEKKLKAVQEALVQEENEKKHKVAQETLVREEKEKKLKAAQEVRQREEKEKNLKAATEAHECEKKLKADNEAREQDETKETLIAAQEALGREENKKKLFKTLESLEHKENGNNMEAYNEAFWSADSQNKEAQGAHEYKENDNKTEMEIEALLQDEKEKVLREAKKAIGREENEKKLKPAQVVSEQVKVSKMLKLDLETHEKKESEKNIKDLQVSLECEENKNKFKVAQEVLQWIEKQKRLEAGQRANVLKEKGNILKTPLDVTMCQDTKSKEKNMNETHTTEESDKEERTQREKEHEVKQLRKIEEREREREREKDRIAVERATREARERAFSEARERVAVERMTSESRERAAVERVTAEARQRAMAEARERAEKTSAEAREKSLTEKASMEARLRLERAAVERATAEARERAAEKAMAEKAARDRQKKENEMEGFVGADSSKDGHKQNYAHDQQFQSAGSTSGVFQRYSSSSNHASYSSEKFQGAEGESATRCKARSERNQRTIDRAAKALAEKSMRDVLAQREQAERNRLAETLDADVRRWSNGKEGNLRALLSTLQYILGTESGWQPVPLTDVITAVAVKKAYRKATLCVHPDKLQQRGASIQQKYVCEKVFDLLKEAWNKFNSEER